MKKKLHVVGDRVLILPETKEKTDAGLYLPAGAVTQPDIQCGRVVETGPGTPIPSATDVADEPWKPKSRQAHYLPVQARIGDTAIFFRKAAVEIKFEETDYVVVPESSILVLVREEAEEAPNESELF